VGRSHDRLNFWALSANSSKTVKATDFKFDKHNSQGQLTVDGDMQSHERLLEATFQEKYCETDIGLYWTCVEGLKWF